MITVNNKSRDATLLAAFMSFIVHYLICDIRYKLYHTLCYQLFLGNKNMSQIFDLCLATETLTQDAQQLGVTVEDLKRIQVRVSATLMQQPEACLQLHYYVTLPFKSLAAQLNWPTWQFSQVGFTDYLWEQTCLECFLAGRLVNKDRLINNNNTTNTDEITPYIELNASPDGRYALYQFKSYRNPATLPPNPLLQADRQTRASINWTNTSKRPIPLLETEIDAKAYSHASTAAKSLLSEALAPKNISSKLYHYERSFRVPLHQLFNKTACINDPVIEYIHPCVILYFGDTALYFAPKHASPPDFHNRQYWTPFDEQAALAK